MSDPATPRRTRTQRVVANMVTLDDRDDEADEYEEPVSPKKKKAKTSKSVKSKPKKIKGSLASFASLPLDVVAEVASYDMATVWEQARINSGLPKLTAGHSPSLIGYAMLMFGHTCLPCNKSTTKGPFLGLYIRYCQKCADEKISTRYDVYPILRSGYDAAGRERKGYAYRLSDVDAYYAASAVDLSHTEVQAREKDEIAMAAWLVARSNEQAAHRNAIKDARRQAIEDHFRTLGWTERSLQSQTFQSHSLVNVARELTDRTRDNVFTTLTIILEGERARVEEENRAEAAREAEQQAAAARDQRKSFVRLALERLLFDEQAQRDSGLFPLPNVDECLELGTVKQLYVDADANFDADTKLEAYFDAIAAELEAVRETLQLQLADKWIAFRTQPIGPSAGAAPGSLPSLPDPEGFGGHFSAGQKQTVLRQATTIFECARGGCGAIGPWEVIFSHVCIDKTAPRSLKPDCYSIPNTKLGFVSELIDLAGLTLDATVDEMDAVGDRAYSCLSCAPSLATIARSWTQQLRHLSARHATPYWHAVMGDPKIVCEEEEAAVARLLRASAECTSGY